MKIIRTNDIQPYDLNHSQQLYVYNGLDCCITYEVLDELIGQLTPTTRATYEFSKSLQGPILDMNSFGLRVDEDRRKSVLESYKQQIRVITNQLNMILREGIDFQFEVTRTRRYRYPSNMQLKDLFFNVMGLAPIYNGFGEDRSLTVDRKALEKLKQNFYAEPIVAHILLLRDLAKKCSFLETAIDPDGRLRTSFNIAGTSTGRLASSFSDFGTGTNLQNVENQLRAIFIADPGWKFCNIDLEQSDARVVGAIHWNLFRDARYLDLCESGDLHTGVSRLAFPNLPWTGEPSRDRTIANGRFYRGFSYRDAAKRLGHGSNYQGQPDKMSRETHIPLEDVKRFQSNYLPAFPAFPLWWEWVEREVRDKKRITTLLGRQRTFFGHPNDSDTIRAAVAYEPQSVTADTINRAMIAVWQTGHVQMLLQVHDSILFQYREADEEWVVPEMLALCTQTNRLKEGRLFTIPAEAKVGYNWSDTPSDPNSMRKFNDTNRPGTRTYGSSTGLTI